MSFVHLHVHSEYSLLDGFSNIKKLVARAKALEMPAVALTDHGTMFGVIDFYNAATNAGIKPIIGVEAYLAARGMDQREVQYDKQSSHLLLLAENQTGYQNLLKIASAAQLDGFYYRPRIDRDFLAAHAEGLICTSGCMAAEVPRLIQNGQVEKARKQLDWYYETFGAQNFFLELQSHDIPELDEINKILLDLGRRYDARFVATNDVHYINKEDARLQDILLAVQTGCLISDPNRMRMSDNSYYLRSAEEMAQIFTGIPGAVSNTLLIAERCEVDLSFKGYHLPEFEVPEGHTAESYLRELCEAGLRKNYGARADDAEVRTRLDYELGIIHQMGFDAYFLIVWDLCRYASSRNIWYNARGSAAGSIVAYTLAITMVDPINHGLIFERFLNPGRVSMPDIDLDFPDDRRAEMMRYTADKYGDDKVAQIITFGTLGARAAIRDVGRVMDIPLNEVDKVAKLVPAIPGKPMTIEKALDEVTEFKQLYQSAPYLRELIDTASKMEGVVRNAGTHAAGVIVTDKPIIEYLPLHRPTGSAAEDSPVKTVTQFEMKVVDELGLLKVDFLGLATLTIMTRACELIKERHGIEFNLYNIPTDDPATYELLGRGETAGVFQVEGSGMRRYLIQMKPKSLANVIAMVALFRPGPMDFIPGYIRRMHGVEDVTYGHPLLEDIFDETYGYPVYQEQLMFAAMKLAGYTPSEADDLRKAIAKKIAEKLKKHRQKFIDGAVKQNVDQDTAAAIFDDWEEFARYGFNKSHAVDYGVIAVQTAYLKTHYPIEYMTALLSVSKNDTGKVALYAADCRRMDIPVEPPDINASDWDFSIEDRPDHQAVIRFGLGAVKNVGQGPVETILAARAGVPFTDLTDLARRLDLRKVGRRALESLIKVGALDSFGQRTALLEAMDRVMAVSASHFRAAESGQMSLFGAHTGIVDEIELPQVSFEISRREILNWERELIGLYVTDHPLNPVMDTLQDVVTHFSGQLVDASPDEKVRIAGLITRVRHHQTRKGKPMGFVTLEDIQGAVDLVIFPRTWAQTAEIIEIDRLVLVEGRLDNDGAEPKVLVDTISTEFQRYVSADQPAGAPPAETSPKPATPPGLAVYDKPAATSAAAVPPAKTTAAVPEKPAASSAVPANTDPVVESALAEKATEDFVDDDETDWRDNLPPEPDFPDDWDYPFRELSQLQDGGAGFDPQDEDPPDESDGVSSNSPGAQSLLAEPEPAPALAGETSTQPPVSEPAQGEAGDDRPADRPASQAPALGVERLSEGGLPSSDPPDKPSKALPLSPGSLDSPLRVSRYLLSPTPGAAEDEGTVRMITVVLRSTGDKTRDVLRLRRIHGMITTYPGNDRFAFQVYERGRFYLLEFPNLTAGVCDELLDRLRGLVGAENVRIETITFQ